ncbi:predicted protein [Chaetoceros tenuissimus]|uniref:Uncharacterized protein n=1 Tax=Chaetoceros tenuissimus TaxID=426638 RepID=A0AAD3CMQ2_9STRA|nr:predicted protein [Chaetoceros tenuissimus]
MPSHSNLSGSSRENDSLTNQDTTKEVTMTATVTDDQQVTTIITLTEKLDRLENFEKSLFALSKTIETNKSSYREDTPENNDEVNNSVSFYLSKFFINLESSDIEDEEQKERLESWINKYPKSLGAINWNYVEGGYEDYDHSTEEYRKKEKKHPFVLREIILKKKFELIEFFVEIGKGWFNDSLRGGLLKDLRKSRWQGLDYDVLSFYSEKIGPTALDVLVYGGFTDADESIPIQILTVLKDKDLFRKGDIQKYVVDKGLFGENQFRRN